MDRLYLPRTERSPLVELDVESHRLRIEGESYPEDAAAFFGPILALLDTYLGQCRSTPPDSPVVLDVRLLYFNSSSAKALMNVFQRLEAAARAGVEIEVNWHYHPDDETMMEFGEDFSEDFEAVRFDLRASETELV